MAISRREEEEEKDSMGHTPEGLYSEYDSPGYRGVRGYKEGEEEGGEDG